MRYDYSTRLRDDVQSAVTTAFRTYGIVNITAVAERIRLRNLDENVALEDVEHLVLAAAQLLGAAIEFEGLTMIDHLPDAHVNGRPGGPAPTLKRLV
ncbi:hypothetical protein [Mesorhizobium sp. BR1-1-2]|uniref:hypothetical protein n=1 Tax=Mesorhizobium sp. BR1-1-2 TaxID=2876652 RepID=UPI001CCAE230|nr:hypothetical protein [Mesorhizobium sp. BR1-1-2]MBZ9962801.1 hypothetical protein [Mesorhizobium sp. BR1-1-2]